VRLFSVVARIVHNVQSAAALRGPTETIGLARIASETLFLENEVS